MGGLWGLFGQKEDEPFYGPTYDDLGYVPPSTSNWSWDQFLPTVSNLGSRALEGFGEAIKSPFEQAGESISEAQNPWETYLALNKAGFQIPTGIVSNIFSGVMQPVEEAAHYYGQRALVEDNPNASEWLRNQALSAEAPEISKVGGGSVRDLAEAGELGSSLGLPFDIGPITDPYALKTIETGSGELLEELADPTNIPGALVGAAGMMGRGASNIDRILAGMGVLSGAGSGIPTLAEGISDVSESGFTPEAYSKLLEGTIGAGFGALSAQGLSSEGTIPPGSEHPLITASRNLLTPESSLGSEAGVFSLPPWNPEDIPALPSEPRIEPEAWITSENIPWPTSEELGLPESPIRPPNSYKWGVDPEADIFAVLAGTQQAQELIPGAGERRIQDIPVDIERRVDPIQNALQESTSNALNAKVNALQNLGFGENTIGGLTPDQANEILSGGIGREQFNPNKTYEEQIQEVMRQNMVDQSMAEEILANEGIYPPPGEVSEANIVYHGTPYDFDQFDLSKIGTGEGAQAYGYGFYFAENPDVAKDYAEKLEPVSSIAETTSEDILQQYETKERAIAEVDRYLNEMREAPAQIEGGAFSHEIKLYEDIRKHLEQGVTKKSSQVLASQIPSPEEFLDLDVPLGEQSEKVKQAIPDVIQRAERYEPNLIKAVHDIQPALDYLEKSSPLWAQANPDIQDIKLGVANYLKTGNKKDIEGAQDIIRGIARDIKPGTPGRRELFEMADNLDSALNQPDLSQTLESRQVSSPEKTKRLQEQGLKGVKYFDRQSRNDRPYRVETRQGASSGRADFATLEEANKYAKRQPKEVETKILKNEEGTRNYVVFDPKDIKILEKTKDISRDNLQKFVDSVKAKYGKTWKKKLTPKEKTKINDLQMELSRVIPESWEKMSEAQKDAYLKGELPEHYTEDLRRKEEALKKGKEDIKAKIKAIGPGPGLIPNVPTILTPQQQVQQSLAEYQAGKVSPPVQLTAQSLMARPLKSKVPPPSTPKPPIPPKVSKPSSPKVPSLQLKNLGRFERAAFTEERNIAKTSPEISKAEKAYREYLERESSKAIADFREAIKDVKKSESRIVQALNGNPVPNLTQKESVAITKLRNQLVNFNNPPKFNSLGEIETFIGTKIRDAAKAQFLSGLKFKGDQTTKGIETERYVRDYIKRLKGDVTPGIVAKAGAKLRKWTALANLQLTQILQASQIVHTTSYVGYKNSARAAWKMLKGFKKQELQALRDGALWPTISHEVGSALGKQGYLHGTPTVDKALRIHANIAGRLVLEKARKNDRYAKRLVSELFPGRNLNSISPGEVGKAISDKTQFRTDIAHLPGWAHADWGKMVWQYQQFAYRHTKFMYDMIKGGPKNSGQILRGAILAGTIGEGIADARAIIRALVPGDDEDDDLLRREIEALAGDPKLSDAKLSKRLEHLFRSNERFPFRDSRGNMDWDSAGWRILQNMSMIGGAGMFQNLIDKILYEKEPLKLMVGPALSQVGELAEAGRKDIEKGEFREVPKFGLKKVPLPFYPGSKIAGKVYPPKSKRVGESKFPGF